MSFDFAETASARVAGLVMESLDGCTLSDIRNRGAACYHPR
jgi:hypothetical protein